MTANNPLENVKNVAKLKYLGLRLRRPNYIGEANESTINSEVASYHSVRNLVSLLHINS
jgi:hypothetical protein